MQSFEKLLQEVTNCQICAPFLPHGVRPVVQLSPTAPILIAGQAPGRRVHESGVPFEDPSGDRLRKWMAISHADFYNPDKVAILPMGFCYPGSGKSGDLPPRPECAPAWRKPLLAQLSNLALTLVIGQYAMDYHLPGRPPTVTQTVKQWRDYWPTVLPLPHPSPRNNIWLRRNPWFDEEVVPALQERVQTCLSTVT